ncbi:hypothetical protein [Halomonas salinarum]|uniref:hypothetical protein n=1 Tax=Halomonas salinarum TaxID=1158993 RepID=UPI00143AC017|nr:hypothetical protein [Halomonas salinarum]
MNRFRRHLIAIGLISSLILPVTAAAGMQSDARQAGGPHQGPHLEMMAELNLTEEQRQALKEPHQRFQEERQTLRAEQSAAIDEILTEEQLTHLQTAREARHTGGQHHETRHDQQQERLGALFASWSLSDEERTSLHEAHQTLINKLRALHDEEFASRDDRRAAIEALRREHEAALAEVLTEEQRHALSLVMMPHRSQHPHGHHGDKGGHQRGESHQHDQAHRDN